MSWSSIPDPPLSRNASTMMRPLGSVGGQLAPSPREAYAFARSADRLRPPLAVHGHRLYWVSVNGVGSCDLHAGSSSFAVIGRHTHCDVNLLADPSISLRHLLVRSTVLDDGCPLLSVLDLQTDDGFELVGDENDQRPRSVSATGVLVVRVGSYVLVAIPSGSAPPELPPAVMTSGHPYRGQRAEPLGVSRITMMPSAVHLSERPFDKRLTDDGSDRGRWELLLLAPRGHARALVSGADLDRGVLVGRAPRCMDGGMRSLMDMNISRVHALLLRGPRGLIVYDVASTQGTYVGDVRVRAAHVGVSGTDLWLGSGGVRLMVLVR